MLIHSFFILQESGVCIYDRNFSEQFKFEINLITPFFSALFSFSQKVVSKKIEVLEMGDLRFVFKKEKGYIFVILSSSKENLLFLNSRLDNIINLFFKMKPQLMNDFEEKGIENTKFDEFVDSLMYGKDEVYEIKSRGLYDKVIEYLKEMKVKKEIKGSALLTTKGTIIYSSLTNDLLMRVMKELEIRYMTGTFDVPELFYTLGNGEKVCERMVTYKNFISLLLVLQFDSETQLGMVDYRTEVVAEKLKSFL
ncbi:MAG: hypothetical protein GF353_03035 [Candidatus Lokiarchaeota archaeon]|nr:hypothetical protein [Candidatus Lokiarchaeota archaeon]